MSTTTTTSQIVESDIQQGITFLDTLFAPGDVVGFRPIETWTERGKKCSRVDFRGVAYRTAGAKDQAGQWQPCRERWRIFLVRHLECSATARTNSFFGVCPRFAHGGGTKSYDQAWQIRLVRALWSDIDHVTVDEARERCKSAKLPEPSIIVNSGNGCHVYWLLSEPFAIDDAGDPDPVHVEFIDQGPDKKKKTRKYRLDGQEKLYLDVKANVPALSPKAQLLQDILAGVASKIGGDHTTDLSRLLRLPGTLNRKDQRNGREPVPCVLVECDPTRRYSWEVFAPFAEVSPNKAHREKLAKVKLPTPRKPSPTKRDKYGQLLAACDTAEVGQRSEVDYGLCCFAIKAGMTKTEVWADVHNLGKFAEGGERYFERTWTAAETEVRTEILERAVGGANRKASSAAENARDGMADKKKSQATTLVDLAMECEAELWHNTQGDAYATLPVEQHREHWPLRAKGFRRWLARQYYLKTEGAPGSEALQAAINVLEGKALFDGVEFPIFVRTAEYNDNIYIDLCDPAWRAVECSPQGWRVIDNPPIRFRRAKAMLLLPEPARGGCVDELRAYVNVRDDDWPLLVAWLLAAYRPRGPYPVLDLYGEQGSAKSTTAKGLRSLVDPNAAPLRCEPREPRDLMIAATNGWLVALDNLSCLPTWLSDALCRLSTGGGFSTRELYTDQDEVVFDAMRPAVITGIEEIATRSDLLDRSVMVSLPTIPEGKRRSESEFWATFQKAQPAIFGAMLSAVCEAMKNINTTTISRLPRMADFALWAVSGEQAMGLQVGEFMAAYTANRSAGNDLALEVSPVAQAVLEFMATKVQWIGKTTDLLNELEAITGEKTRKREDWPKGARSLGGGLKRLAPNFRRVGIEVNTDGHTGRGSKKRKVVTLTRTEQEISCPTCPSCPEAGRTASSGADGVANKADGAGSGAGSRVDASPCDTSSGARGADGAANLPLCSSEVGEEVAEWTA